MVLAVASVADSGVPPVALGSLVVVYEGFLDRMKAVRMVEGGVFSNRFGTFRHADLCGLPFGSCVWSAEGRGYVHLLQPTPELWTQVLPHRTQILYIADISFVLSRLELRPGSVVLESGTGSASLTTSLARGVAPHGHVYTFEFHAERAAAAQAELAANGLAEVTSVTLRDVQGQGFPADLAGHADAVFLDLPRPWEVVPSAARSLRHNAPLCSFSPCVEQVQRSCAELQSCGFADVQTFEVLVRSYELCRGRSSGEASAWGKPQGPQEPKGAPKTPSAVAETEKAALWAKPLPETRGHTGYLTFARCVSQGG